MNRKTKQKLPAGDPMCNSAPIDLTDPASVSLGVGDESFFWSADARIRQGVVDARLVLAMAQAGKLDAIAR